MSEGKYEIITINYWDFKNSALYVETTIRLRSLRELLDDLDQDECIMDRTYIINDIFIDEHSQIWELLVKHESPQLLKYMLDLII